MKTCPICETKNAENATECTFCGYDFAEPETEIPTFNSAGELNGVDLENMEDDAVSGKQDAYVRILDIGQNKIAVIKVVKEFCGYGLADAKTATEKGVVGGDLTYEQAEQLAEKLRGVGATTQALTGYNGPKIGSTTPGASNTTASSTPAQATMATKITAFVISFFVTLFIVLMILLPGACS